MRICDFCGSENKTDNLEKSANETCYNCGNNLGDKRFREAEPEPVKVYLTSKQPSKTFQLFVWVIIIPVGFLLGLLLLYVTYASWRP